MQVKVIKAINGLEEGDILNYNEKTHKYELKKIEEDISDNGYSSKKTLHTYSKNIILDNPTYFEFIDKDGDKIEVKEEIKSTETIEDWKSECIKLHNQIKDLEKQLDQKYITMYTTYPTRWYNPFENYILC
jgi:hypothetical protein